MAIKLTILDQPGAPMFLAKSVHDIKKDFFRSGRIVNGKRAITAYRLGWVLSFPDKAAEVDLGAWVNIPSTLPPEMESDVPSQHIPHSVSERGINGIHFFIAAVVFADGSVWQENLQTITRRVKY